MFGRNLESEFACSGKRVLYQYRIRVADRDTMPQDYFWIITGILNDYLRIPGASGKLKKDGD
jgi:hypothetical protein